MSVLLVMLGGAIGAALRLVVDEAVQARRRSPFPWGTWTVNVTGSFLLGLVGGNLTGGLAVLAGTGLCGALTTYSTFSTQTWQLIEEGLPGLAARNVAANTLACLVAVWAGLLVA